MRFYTATVGIIMRTIIQEQLEDDTDMMGLGDPSKYFGFDAADVEEIFTHKTGVGRGVWFKLKNGAIMNSYGECEYEDEGSYDTHIEHVGALTTCRVTSGDDRTD